MRAFRAWHARQTATPGRITSTSPSTRGLDDISKALCHTLLCMRIDGGPCAVWRGISQQELGIFSIYSFEIESPSISMLWILKTNPAWTQPNGQAAVRQAQLRHGDDIVYLSGPVVCSLRVCLVCCPVNFGWPGSNLGSRFRVTGGLVCCLANIVASRIYLLGSLSCLYGCLPCSNVHLVLINR